ncbi:MAG: hypothetical protein IIX44_08925 [Clostridia bacterium]|nr:hypothetical protein [Clostridia bacterium]
MSKFIFKTRRTHPTLRINSASELCAAVADGEISITPQEAAAILQYCELIGVKLQKKENAVLCPKLQRGNRRKRFLESSLGNIIYTCIKLCDALIKREQAQMFPDADYITAVNEDMQHLSTAWEKITGIGIHEL